MPAVMDPPELDEYVETPDFTIETPEREQSQPRRVYPGFWRTLAHTIAAYLTPTPRQQHAPVCSVRQPFETPLDRLVREHPSLAVYALALI
jgi:hypothetical protein